MKSIVLIGPSGVGKSTVGLLLGRQLSLPFTDLDQRVEEHHRISATEFFRRYDELRFRDAERMLLQHWLRESYGILAIGAGAVESVEFRRLLTGVLVVYLLATPAELAHRLSQVQDRPLIQGTPIQRLQIIRQQMERRQRLYESSADITIDTSRLTPSKCAEQIVQHLSSVPD